MSEVRTGHTADLDAGLLAGIRALLDSAFAGSADGDFTDEDWDHTLGGMHVLVLEGGVPVGHGAVVQRRLLYGGRALRTGYVEGVAVRADRRGRGYGAAVMAEVERIVRAGYDLGALGSSDEATGFYARRGWRPWQGRTSALTPGGVQPTPEVSPGDWGPPWPEPGGEGIYVYPAAVDLGELDGELTCDWRDGDVW